MSEKPNTPETRTETPAPDAKTVSASEINASVGMPAPSERTIGAMMEDEAPDGSSGTDSIDTGSDTSEVRPGTPDKFSRPYNPEKHLPKLNSRGSWCIRTGGRPRKDGQQSVGAGTHSNQASPSVVGTPDGLRAADANGKPTPDRYDAAAEMYCRTGYGVFGMLFNASEEWQPDTLAEHEVIREPMARYLRCKQTEDLPPGTLLLLAISLYSIPRLARPKTKERIQKLFKRREPQAQLAELPQQVSPEMLKAS